MDNNIFNEINTTLNLNGPILSFTENPTGATGIGTTEGATGGASVSFTGIATADLLGNSTDGTGYLSYQWYEVDVGKLSNSTYVTGTASTGPIGTGATLTISNLITPRDNQRKFYVQADYVASAYQQDQLGIAKSTGNAWNEPLSSGIGTATVTPLIEIVAQPPQGRQALINQNASMTVNADLTDSYFADDLLYQWYLNGEEVSDGTVTVTTVTGTDTYGIVEQYFAVNGSHYVQPTAIGDAIITIAGGEGGKGGNDASGAGGAGSKGSAAILHMPTSKAVGKTFYFKIGKKGNDGGSGRGTAVAGAGGKVTWLSGGSGTSTDTSVTFTIIESTTGDSANQNSDFRFGLHDGNYTLTARSGSHVRYVPFNAAPIDCYPTKGDTWTTGHVRFSNDWKTLDWIKPSNVSILNAQPTLSITCSRGKFQSDGTKVLDEWYNYSNINGVVQPSSVINIIQWVSGAAPTIKAGDEDGDGGDGGGAGRSGWSGGGGGGGAATLMVDSDDNVMIVAAGGAGGGGGSLQDGGTGGTGNSLTWAEFADNLGDGDPGESRGASDGGGGGGGGGGAPRGLGGSAGVDRGVKAKGGYAATAAADFSEWFNESAGYTGTPNAGDGYANIRYTSKTSTQITTVKKTTVSGTTTPTLTIATDTVGVQTCQCKISSATASNSPIWTNVVSFVASSAADQNNIKIENIGISVDASNSNINLNNGDFTFDTSQSQASSGSITKYFSFYSPDKDMAVEMDLYGGKGVDKGSYVGGEGGYSRIRFTMTQNTEYVIVGLSSDLNAPFLYRKGELVACAGAGGDAGISGDGGNGGGVSNEGQNGGGRESGIGGVAIAAGTLGANGTYGSQYAPTVGLYPGDTQATGQNSGQTIRCTKGVYWAQQGIAACSDMVGSNVFRLASGTPVSNTALITRGFKAGYNIIETGGAKSANGGRGGNGATGGSGGSAGGGGGGSGYNDGSITVVDTQQGGSSGDAKIILRLQT